MIAISVDSDWENETMEFPEVTQARDAFLEGKSLPIKFRRQQLQQLLELVENPGNRDKICDAVFKDLRKGVYEATLTEIVGVKMQVQSLLAQLGKATKPRILGRNLAAIRDTAGIRREPHGVVLILGTWSHPFYTCLLPLAGAIAAGNCAVVLASDTAGNSAHALADLVSQYLDKECYHVLSGDEAKTRELLTNEFDHIYFTGPSYVGKTVLKLAADHFTPVTVQKGGKNPVYLHNTGFSKLAVKRILAGKLMNLGQTSVAPDYVICSLEVQDAFIKVSKAILKEWYPDVESLQHGRDLSRIVNGFHFHRLKSMMDSTRGAVLLGGRMDENDLWIEPTFVGNVGWDDALMEREIFGPILPLVTVESVDEAVHFMRASARPLTLYIFCKDETVTQDVIDLTYSGGVVINDTISNFADFRLPFGDTVEEGKDLFHTFSRPKPIISRGLGEFTDTLANSRWPPFTPSKLKKMERLSMLSEYSYLRLGPCVTTHVVAAFLGFCFYAALARLVGSTDFLL